MLFFPRMEKENRAHPRYEVDAHADLGAIGAHPIQNLSLGGICIQTSVLQDVGKPVDVLLRFPELGSELSLRGEVVWVNRTPPQDVGIRWIGLDEERRGVLRRYLDTVIRAS